MSTMQIFRRHRALAWVAPLLAAVLLVGGAWAVNLVSASADQGLPHRTAAQLLVDVQRARLSGLSGTVVQTSELGLPSIPAAQGGSDSSSLSSMVSGTHTLRLWLSGPDKARMALTGTLGESDVVLNGRDLWTWSSTHSTATHRVLPAHDSQRRPSTSQLPVTPQRAARQALKAIDPSTRVTTEGSTTVAGRAAYELVLQPRDSASLVGQVRIAIDGATHVPLRVQVLAKNASSPAVEVAFTQFDPTRPEPSRFRFNPPPGTTVTQEHGMAMAHGGAMKGQLKGQPHAETHGQMKDRMKGAKQMSGALGGGLPVVGTGWTGVLVTPATGMKASALPDPLGRVLTSLPTVSGSWGSGHLFSGPLFSVLVTDDGRVAAGAVTPEALYAALGQS